MNIKQRAAGERGAIAVEFALIFPLLALILFGVLEFGRVWSQVQGFQAAAREGARCAAVQAAGVSTCDISTTIVNAASPYTPDFSGGGATLSVSVNVGGVDVPGSCDNGTRGDPVTVSWPQNLNLDIPFWSSVTIRKTISGVFRCE